MTGRVYWITGLSCAGKSTVSRCLHKRLLELGRNVVLLDGDELREAIADDLGYEEEGRRRSAMRNAKLCRLLSGQGLDVICATISLFHDCHRWNRENIPGYFEVYLCASIETLMERDQKGLYLRAMRNEINHVYGVDLVAEEPKQPDLRVDAENGESPEAIVMNILNTSEKAFMA